MTEKRSPLDPDPEMWEALEEGPGLRSLLEKFYDRVYEDPRLSPFFGEVTKEHAIQKQYHYLSSIFTGNRKSYFGLRPRNAHHWMVIDDDLFDHREAIMEAVLIAHGLAPHLVKRFRDLDEVFRKQIVKSEPKPIRIKGMELPLGGFEHIQITVGSMCDGCSAEIFEGDWVRAHRRTGKTYCATCMPDENPLEVTDPRIKVPTNLRELTDEPVAPPAERPKPRIVDRRCAVVELAAGEHAWCSCGESTTGVLCDGTSCRPPFEPVKFTVAEPGRTMRLCQCKHTEHPPICDGAHHRV